jgi:hypothetical protein
VLEQARHRLGRAPGEPALVRVVGRACVVDAHCELHVRAVRQVLELVVDEEKARARVLDDLRDLALVEPVVERDEDAACRGHAEVRLEQRRRVRADERHPVALLEARLPQRGGQAVHALAQLPVGVAPVVVDHCDLVGVDKGAALQERHGVELGAVHAPPRLDGLQHVMSPSNTPGRPSVAVVTRPPH